MAKEKSLVEEAIIQMKNLEEAVAENAKGILASTMSQEIKELVKESLFEQESEDEIEDDADVDMGDMGADVDNDSEEDDTEDDDMGYMEDDDIEEPIDLTTQSDEEVLRVFQLMGPEDNIVVTKDAGGNINLKDTEANKEYMIVGESDEDEWSDDDFNPEGQMDEEEDDQYYEGLDKEMYEEEDYSEEEFNMNDDSEEMFEDDDDIDTIVKEIFGDTDTEEEDDDTEVMYEIEFDDEEEEDFDDEEEEEEDFDNEEEEEDFGDMYESKLSKRTIKPKGVGMGKGPNVKTYSKNPNQGTGFKTKMKLGSRSVGTGKAKFEYKEQAARNPKNSIVKKEETKEGVRTLGAGSRAGRKGGLPKPRTGSAFNIALKESETRELHILREKNEEYRKALNIFRNKLNEVAVFNSNLAYATRLFTEHSTSKQEKINILRRFDGVESIKESKGLYKTIKDELLPTTSQSMNESFERKIENAPTTGSAINLIENKTYENPQFLRMKDLMSKMK